MTHNSCHEVTSVEFRDWMEVNVEVKRKKRKRGGCTSPLRVEARCMRPSSAERRVAGWICIHGVGPWENVSLGCIVSHIRSHLENHLPTSPCSSSLSPPLALPVHSRTNTQKNYPQNSFIPRLSNCLNAEQLYTQMHTHSRSTHIFFWRMCFFNHWPSGFYYIQDAFVKYIRWNSTFVHFHCHINESSGRVVWWVLSVTFSWTSCQQTSTTSPLVMLSHPAAPADPELWPLRVYAKTWFFFHLRFKSSFLAFVISKQSSA